MAVFRAGR